MGFLDRLVNALVNLHPLHSPTVHFPIALSGAAFLFLVLGYWRKDRLLEGAAFLNLALVVPAVVVAAITGLRDYAVRYGGDAPVAGVKIVLALILFFLALLTVWYRWQHRRDDPLSPVRAPYLIVFGLCFALALVLGFLGGVIVWGF
jgi:uncharacterized membrane protein